MRDHCTACVLSEICLGDFSTLSHCVLLGNLLELKHQVTEWLLGLI